MPLRKAGSIYILVIEDDQAIREFLANQLAGHGYKVMTADNGSEAVECIRNSKFHAVISDLRMPGMDGIETLEAIRKVDRKIPVIMTSGYTTAEAVARAIDKGAYHFLQKPFSINELLRLVEKAVEESALDGLEGVLETVMDRLEKSFDADECSVMMTDPDKRLYIACSRGLSKETVYSTTLRLGERVAGLAAQNNRKFLINGGLEKYPEFRGIEKKPRIRSSIVVPVHYQGKLLGVLNLNRTKTASIFSSKDLQEVSTFIARYAPAIYEAKVREILEDERRQQIIRRFLSPLSENKPV